jgi:single-stranded-DNA-specific exonuclease
MRSVELEIPPCSTAAVRRLATSLGLSPVVAEILVRRGLAEPGRAAAFLAADEFHSPSAFRGIDLAVERVLGHVRSGAPITVHGDYDCDGVCSTAVLVRCLRELGADVDWFLPDRRSDGYGLSLETIRRLADRGTKLLITADCAITAVDEVAAAHAAGVDVVLTDHHTPRSDGRLPDAPIVHPSLCGYPCIELCATAVAAKLAQALRAAADPRGTGPRATGLGATGLGGRGEHRAAAPAVDGDERAADLELVALATVADVVALQGENRRLVRAGLRALASTSSPGLRALMAVSRVAPEAIDEHALAFRLAPRINAAGRLYRADIALELLLTEDPARAATIAAELDRDNAERRNTETRIRFEAEAQVVEQGDRPAYVLAGEDWHPGVIGIVAARIAERHHRPTVLIALDSGGGPGTGSGRSIPAFDLLGGLQASAERLIGYGGHRAAAGLQIEAADVEAFRAAFTAHASDVLEAGDLVARERVDAIVSGEDLGLELAEELLRLAPFGAGNPPVSLLVAAATLADPVGFGGDDRTDHVRFSVRSGGASAQAVHFGAGAQLPVAAGQPVDATFRLERNEWRGSVEPRLLLREARVSAPPAIVLRGEDAPYLERVIAELTAPLEVPTRAERTDSPCSGGAAHLGSAGARVICDRRGRGVAATIAGLVASGESVLVVGADATARMRHLRSRLGGFGLCSHGALVRSPELADEYAHVVLLDPPSSAIERVAACADSGGGATHLAWGEPELRFALHIHQQEFGLRTSLASLYRVLRDLGSVAGGELETALRGDPDQPRSPELAGRLLRVFVELDLVEFDRENASVGVLEGRRAELEGSSAFRHYQRRLEDGQRYLGKSAALPYGDSRAA